MSNIAKKYKNNKHWWAPDMCDAQMLRAKFCDHVFPPHAHNSYTIALVTGGEFLVRARRENQILKKGDIILFNPGEVHSGQPAGKNGWKMRSMHFGLDFLKKYSQGKILDRKFSFRGSFHAHDLKLSEMLFKLHWCSETDGPKMKRRHILSNLVTHLISAYGDEKTPNAIALSQYTGDRAVSLAKEYMNDDISRNASLEELAAVTNLSKYHFLRKFSKKEGITPHAWLTQRRVEVSAQKLKDGEAKKYGLSGIAYDCGFSDQAHFTREFKRIIGVTPGVYASEFAHF